MKQAIGGLHPVRETLEAGSRKIYGLHVSRSPKDVDVQPILRLAQKRRVPVRYGEARDLDRMTRGLNHQGVVLEVAPLQSRKLSETLKGAGAGSQELWIALDEVTDPHNFGAILRSAACFGVRALLHADRRSAKLSPLVEKIASGGAERVEIVQETNLNQAIVKMKKAGFWVYGAAVEGRPVQETKFHAPTLLVIGAEGKGIRKRTKEHCDELIRIPMAEGGPQSLNASCAASVLLYEVDRQRRQK